MTKLEQARRDMIDKINQVQNENNLFVNVTNREIDEMVLRENGWKIEPETRNELKALETFHQKALDIKEEYLKGYLTYQEAMEHLMKKAVNSKYSKTLVYYLAEAIAANLNETRMIEIASDIYNAIMGW